MTLEGGPIQFSLSPKSPGKQRNDTCQEEETLSTEYPEHKVSGQSIPETQDTQPLGGAAPWRMSHLLQNNERVQNAALSQFKGSPRCEGAR